MQIKDNFVFRARLVYAAIFILGIFIVGRLFFIQVVNGEYYRDTANSQYVGYSVSSFDRGTIYFKKKDDQIVSAATVKKGYVLAIKPNLLKDAKGAYDKITGVLENISIDEDDFLARANKKNDPYERIARKLTEKEAEKIMELGISGVSVSSDSWRFYPAGNLASRVLGFVGYKNNKLAGRYGLERQYENVLSREETQKTNMNSFAEIFSGIKEIVAGESKEGDIILTIEPEAQGFLEGELNEMVKKYEPEMAGGIIIEPSTGKILAMSVKPDFDPNSYGSAGNLSLFLNPATQNIFEMGSIMKPLTMAAAIDRGAVTAKTTYNDKGYFVFNGSRIENYDGKGRGIIDMQEVLNQSLNTGAVFAMQSLGKEKFQEYMTEFGFGERTGIDLPNEVVGLISNLKSNRDIEYATASFGQGIAVTPIAMASALSALANGGLLMKPYVVEEIKFGNGEGQKFFPEERRRVFKEGTSEEISRMLVNVVDDALFNGKIKLKNYSVAAKTGTAQIHNDEGGGYSKDKYLHSFFGYAPAFNPKFLTLLFLVKPQGVNYSLYSLAKPFMSITKFMINYYDIPPDR